MENDNEKKTPLPDDDNKEDQQKPAKKDDKLDLKKPPNKSNPDEVYEWVAKRISGPSFRNPLKNFIDENCITFIDIDENTHEQGQLFRELNILLENALEEIYKDGELTQEDFLKAAERGVEDKKYKKYFNQVINFGDYNFFKSIMTKRNYQIIKMAEQQMANAASMEKEQKENLSPEESEQKTKEYVAKLLEEENKELDEAIKASLAEEDKRRRIAAIEEEEMNRALKNSLMMNPEPNDIPKKEEPKPEPKKEEPKKFTPVISSTVKLEISGYMKPPETKKPPEEEKPEIKPEIKTEKKLAPSEQKGFVLESSNINIAIESQENPYAKNSSIKPKKEEPKEEIKPKEDEVKNSLKVEEEPNEEPKNEINEIKPKKAEEKVTREFINIYEEKKRTLKPLGIKHNINNSNTEVKKSSLMKDLQKRKGNIKNDIERMNIKKENKPKPESAIDIIKNNLNKDNQNNNDIINLDGDGDGLLIDDNEEENDNNNKYVSKHNIHFGKIEIPNNFSGKIPEYTKEKQEELKEYRDMVIKQKMIGRENEENDI